MEALTFPSMMMQRNGFILDQSHFIYSNS